MPSDPGSSGDTIDACAHAPDAALREQAAQRLVDKGVELDGLGRSEAAIAVYDEIAARYADDPEPTVRVLVARALGNKAVGLGRLGRSEPAIAVYDEIAARYADEPFRGHAAWALLNKGVALGVLERWEEANAVYDGIVDRYANDAEPAVRGNAVGALYNKGIRLGALGRTVEEIAVYDQIVALSGDAPAPVLRELVGLALYNKGIRLTELGQVDEAKATLRDAVKQGDPNAARSLAWLAASSNDVAEFDEASEQYGRLAVARELQGQWWASADLNFSELSAEQFTAVQDAFQQFVAPYGEKVAEGERDPYFLARATAAAEMGVRVSTALADEADKRAARSRVVAEAARAEYEAERERILGSAQTVREMKPIPGCRLVAGPSGEGVADMTLVVRVPEVVELWHRTEPEPVRVPWGAIRGFQVDPLPDRGRMTAPRLAVLGPFALAAKKRQAWCVLTILWDGRYRTVEVPAQAHELRAAFNAAGVSV